MNDIKTAYSLGSEGMLITRYTEDASFHEVVTKDYHEVIKDMDAGVYDGDLNLALQIVDIVMDASIRDYVSLSPEEKTSVARYFFCLTFVKRMEEDFGRVQVPEALDPLAYGSAVIVPLGDGVMGSASLHTVRELMRTILEAGVLQKAIEDGHDEENVKTFMPIIYGDMVGDDMRANDFGVQAAASVLNEARKRAQTMPHPEKRVLH
ncbi:hypothetical protein AW119_09965 [Escherichia coli]|uniref:hypothetical protein n=1 Tax=Escherichia coli TaxID=562 RepID=UPI000942652C|nr:hypothetical protein [Escherichia coli]EFK1740403.1 hypothetical protein [Escherichia coli]OKV28827.1 hypothetical protein AWP49_14790 [Escherichia coli]OTD38284.1 hypothetical protein AW095_04560 [Escherichia coli]OTE51588.1 hypothetical protein AW119_09965 [Escherichia coli]TJQ47258.1 hypothetical protein C9Z62_12675 [Escherichia coli]